MPAAGTLEAALAAFDKGRWKEARKLLAPFVEQSRPLAAYRAGVLLWRGLGGPQDRSGAVTLFKVAADSGSIEALDALGVAFRSGHGVAQDLEGARALFKAAADQGYGPALINLATMSEPVEARLLMRRAAEAGEPLAMLHLSDMLERDAPDEALAWLYAACALTGDEAAAKRAKALARDLPAREIEAAHRRGREIIKDIDRAGANS